MNTANKVSKTAKASIGNYGPFSGVHLSILVERYLRKDVNERRGVSSVGIETRLRAGRPGLNSRHGMWWDFISSVARPDRLWGPPSLLGLFPWGGNGRGVKLTTHLHVMPRLGMRGAMPPLPNTSSWRGA